ncbi:MAG: type II toxin-antitoxin system VapC family toxin [Cyanobacteria bacterium J06626_6]
MRFLLDTHAFLWFVLDDSRLSSEASSLVKDLDNRVLISPASYWEIAIKVSIGKYEIPGSFQDWIERQLSENGFEVLPLRVDHAARVTMLPFHHRDPFDRLLIAQALTEKIPIISIDGKFDQYSVDRRW